ncbi:hybrid sensor histidine kinase/response regulator [uncultured Massilia sp.]|uniref:hybrid sensor histidine kinase/response regulator n=1 Tax=uncultured Massilia sp. TaxID=169973 RepID=UPI0025EA9062|nr:hybrid sensor histidine kinase/response regulator [uncultured Massilia sp.]
MSAAQAGMEEVAAHAVDRADAAVDHAVLHARVQALEEELARLRAEAQDRRQLEDTVTQLREANEHLVLATVNAQHLRDDAEAANRRQNEFLAMLAHELRNPLSPIAMAASLLERSGDGEHARLARVVGRQVGHMARLLDDLLDAARISSGKITLAPEPLALAEVLRHAVETVQPRIAERAQALELALPAEGVAVEGDRVRLAQVFTNLLANASKYTGDGGRLRLAVLADEDDGHVLVSVEDNGTGIAPETIPHIFDLFTQGPRSLARSEGGLGVGLNVVRNLVGMHGGTVDAYSAGSGQGSRFTVRLPRSAAAPAAPAPAPPVHVAGPRRVLLIEDNLDACATLAGCLAADGHDVATAHDGDAGLALALGGGWDVIVCDIGLPGLDGLGLMQALRAAPAGAAPYAIALSGYGQPDDRERGLQAGFDRYLVKPVAAELLRELVAGAPAAGPLSA